MTPYSGMLPGHVAGHYTYEECHVDLRPLSKFANARFIHAEANGIDTINKKVLIKTGDGVPRPPISYDLLSIDIGISPTKISSAEDTQQKNSKLPISAITPVKPINTFSERWNQIVERVTKTSAAAKIVVVGGGAGGIELTLAMQYRLLQLCKGRKKSLLPQFTVLTRGNDILSSHNRKVRSIFNRILKDRDIRVHPNSEVLNPCTITVIAMTEILVIRRVVPEKNVLTFNAQMAKSTFMTNVYGAHPHLHNPGCVTIQT